MDKEKMRGIACLMLVDMAGDGMDIHGMALALRVAFTFGTDDRFREVCREIGATYKRQP